MPLKYPTGGFAYIFLLEKAQLETSNTLLMCKNRVWHQSIIFRAPLTAELFENMYTKIFRFPAHLEIQDFYGWTPLLHACHHHNWEKVEFLIRKGANILTTDIFGRNCLSVSTIPVSFRRFYQSSEFFEV